MNDVEQIEKLLRKAPQAKVPSGLLEKLQTDIVLPRAELNQSGRNDRRPLLRRWFPALSFGLFFLTCLIALAVQTSQWLKLRRENQSLRAATANLEQLRQENAELQRLRATAQEADWLQKEQEELLKLRAEVAQLRAQAQELAALRTENQRLQAERAAAAAKASLVAEEDPFAKAEERAKRIQCISNIKQICLAGCFWAKDHKDILPADFVTMHKELKTTTILTCPSDDARKVAASWHELDANNVSYEMLSPGIPNADGEVVYVRCPIHNNVGLVDGSGHQLGSSHHVENVGGKFKIVGNKP